MENEGLDTMYDIPSAGNIREVVINEDVILKKEQPVIIYEKKAESA